MLDAYIAFLDRRPDFRVLALGRHISEGTREQQTDPDVGPAALLQNMLVQMFKLKPGPRLKLRLKIAAETGDRLIAYAYGQPTRKERDEVLAELKVMLGRYLLR